MYNFQPEKRSYKISFIFAVLLHVTLVAFLFVKFTHYHQDNSSSQPAVDIIQASAVNQNEIDKTLEKINTEKQQQIELAHQQELAEQQKAALQQKIQVQKQAEAAQKLQQQQAIAKQKVQEQQKAALAAQKQQEEIIAKQKALQQKLAKTKADQEATKAINQHLLEEQKKEAAQIAAKAALQKKAEADAANKKTQQILENTIDKQLAQEGKQLKATETQIQAANAAAQSKIDQAAIDKYKSLIIKAISNEWIIPKDIAEGTTCKLLVTVAPDGVVLKIDIIQKSGNDLLDDSAKTAILKASPLPVPKDLDLFDNFRSLRLTVKPEGIT